MFVHDKEKLAQFFTEDSELVARRAEAIVKRLALADCEGRERCLLTCVSLRDRLTKATAAMANIQVLIPFFLCF